MTTSQNSLRSTSAAAAPQAVPWFKRLAYLARTRLAAVILLVGALNGLLYVVIVPPWQHYDETNHFEYAWLIANRPGLPDIKDYDQEMRRAVAHSMIENGFFQGWASIPVDITATDQPIWIGQYSQLDGLPLYYWLAALPLRLFRAAPYEHIEAQLTSARLVSLLLYLMTIIFAWAAVREVTSADSPLRWMTALFLALLPGFTDLMTAVNSDVGAVAFFTLFLWMSVRLIQRGVSASRLVGLILSLGLCFYTKNTAWPALVFAPLALALALLRCSWRWGLWALVAVGSAAAALLFFSPGDALLWSRNTKQPASIRQAVPGAPLGEQAFVLDYKVNDPPSGNTWQLVPPQSVRPLDEKTFTVGAWVWASRPLDGQLPVIESVGLKQSFKHKLAIDETPKFAAYTFTYAADTTFTVVLRPLLDAQEAPVTVYYDGLLVVQGLRPVDEPPVFDTAEATSGTWGGERFTNLVRNPSAEAGSIRVHPLLDELSMKVFPDRGRLSMVLYTLIDQESYGPYYQTVAGNLFRTFWAKFGWGHVPLLVGNKPYRWLGAFTLVGLAGAAGLICKRGRSLPWHSLLFLGLTLLLVWGIVFVRGSVYIKGGPYVPVARYAYPVILPSVLPLAAGWLAIGRFLEGRQTHRWQRLPGWVKAGLWIGFFIVLNIVSLYSILRFYI